MLAREIKELFGISNDENISVIGFSGDEESWWHIHDDEEIPENWAFKLRKLPVIKELEN